MESRHSINLSVDDGKRVCVLFDHDDIGELGEISDFFDQVGIEELVQLFSDRFALFFSHLPLLL